MQDFEDLDARVRGMADLAADEATELLIEIEKYSRHIEALRHQAHVAIAGLLPRDFTVAGTNSVIRDVGLDEIAFAMKWSTEWTRRQVTMSRCLVSRMPQVLEALSDGEISSYQSYVACEGLFDALAKSGVEINDLDSGGEISENFVERISYRMREQNGVEFRRTVRRAVASLAPEEFEEAFEGACRNRTVKISHVNDGMAWLNAYLPGVDAERAWVAINNAAENLDGENSDYQKLADAFVALVCGGVKNNGVNTEIQVVVGLDTLLELTDEPGVLKESGELVSAKTVRELAETSRLRRLVYENLSGKLIDYGRTTYRPPAALDVKVRARDGMCRAPGCTRSAEKTDLDHTIAWEDGGETSERNLVSLCRRHHNLKTHLNWSYEQMPDGSVLWITPDGMKHKDPPHPVFEIA